jgi:prepilin peptidase CpaA
MAPLSFSQNHISPREGQFKEITAMQTTNLPIGAIFQISMVFVIAFTAAVSDYRNFKIPNRLTFSAMAIGMAWHVFSPYGHGLPIAIGGMAIGFLTLVPFFLVGGMGGGDVKLMMAIGSVLGGPMTFVIFLVSSLVTGVYSVYLMVTHCTIAKTLDRLKLICYRFLVVGQHLAYEDHHRCEVGARAANTTLIPFGVMVAIGTTLIFGLSIGSRIF